MELKKDPKNLNKGTERGKHLIEQSISQLGAGRSIVIDKDGNIIAGNHTYDAALALGLEMVVVPTDGTKLVVVQRTDLDRENDIDDKAAKLAFADNQTGKVNLEYDIGRLVEMAATVDLTGYITDAELRVYDDAVNSPEIDVGSLFTNEDLPESHHEKKLVVKFETSDEREKVVARLLAANTTARDVLLAV